VAVAVLLEVHLRDPVQADLAPGIDQHRDLHAVAGREGQRLEQLAPRGDLAGERLEDAGKLGLQAIAQVDLGERRSRRRADSPTARKVLSTIARRLEQDGRLRGVGEGARERPPLASVRVA
jgi:hypothetical protein